VASKTKPPTLSICMIVKDEQDWLEQCLNSVKDLNAELVIVDTGSKDRTIEIVKSFGAKLFEQTWSDDFSYHRNFSISQASGDWILVLDADEMLEPSHLPRFKQYMQDDKKCFSLTHRHYSNDFRLSSYQPCSGEFPKWERKYQGYFESSICRLFPRRPDIKYQGRIHETLDASLAQITELKLCQSRIMLHHYGYTPEVQKKKDKSKLYTNLGQIKASEESSWKALFELGVEHNISGRKEDSSKAFELSVALNPNYLPTWSNWGYVLCELGRHSAAEKVLLQAIKLGPKEPEVYCNLGVVYLRTANFVRAKECFIRAIELNKKYLNAYTNLALVYLQLKQKDESLKVLDQALVFSARNPALIFAKAGALLECGQPQEAKSLLLKCLELEPGFTKALLALSQLALQAEEMDAACDYLKQAINSAKKKHEEKNLLIFAQNQLSKLEQVLKS